MVDKAVVARRNRARGKATEKAIAQRFGGQRMGIFGREDVRMSLFSVEVKDRRKFVGQGFMEQSVRNCPEGKIPLVVVHITGQRRVNDLVMVRMKDFEDCLGDLLDREKEDV